MHDYEFELKNARETGTHDAFVHCSRVEGAKAKVRIFFDYKGQLFYDDEGLISIKNKLPFTFKGNLGTIFCCDKDDIWLTNVSNIAVARALTKDDFHKVETILCEDGTIPESKSP